MAQPLPNQIEVDAEQRGAERRAAMEKILAEAEVERAIAAVKAAQQAEAIEAARAALRPDVEKARNLLRPLAAEARKRAEKLRAQITAIEAAAGDLEGHVITAGETARHDPKRALAALEAARKAFDAAAKS
jgi:uncharacterized protein YgbK (DUF1537 family)